MVYNVEKRKGGKHMGFAENLKQIRKQNALSQEDLAELLDVSRQAVSKWEQGTGYPEVEKLLLLANKLNISLDSLMATEILNEGNSCNHSVSGKILITSPVENVVVSCYKVVSSQKFKGGKDTPQYALFGVGMETHPFWGQSQTFLGWYADKESLEREIREIQNALEKGMASYELKYNVRTERSWLRIKIVRE